MSTESSSKRVRLAFQDGAPILHVNRADVLALVAPQREPKVIVQETEEARTQGIIQDSGDLCISGQDIQTELANVSGQIQTKVIPVYTSEADLHEPNDTSGSLSAVPGSSGNSETGQVLYVLQDDMGETVYVENIEDVDMPVNYEETVIGDAPAAVYEVVSDGTRMNYTCLVCQSEFDTAEDLDVHARVYHKNPDDVEISDLRAQPSQGKKRTKKPGTRSKQKRSKTEFREDDTAVTIITQHVSPDEFDEATDVVVDDILDVKPNEEDEETDVVVEDIVCLWQCGTCEAEYTSLDTLAEHQLEHVGQAASSSKRALFMLVGVPTDTVDVVEDEVGKKTYTYLCPAFDCDFTAEKMIFVTQHCKTNHPGQKLYNCPRCDGKFISYGTYRRHYILNHGTYFCKICSSRFATTDTLRIHEEKCGTSIQCERCGEQFSSRAVFLAHKKQVHDVATCLICVKQFVDKYKLATHMARVHDQLPEGVHRDPKTLRRNKTRTAPCEVCGKTFCNEQTLERHMKGHQGEYNHTCEHCGKSFLHKSSVKAHMETHEDNEYKCDICNGIFRTSHSLATHKRILHRPKRHQCELCSRKFSGQHHLVQHMRTHTGEKPFTCETCSQAFAQLSTLKNHIRNVHLKEKRYKCSLCPSQFYKIRLLEAHMETHQETGNGYRCAVCGFNFQTICRLRTHLMQCHMENSDSE